MVALARPLVLAALLRCPHGVRREAKFINPATASSSTPKFIAGVPVHHYEHAYAGVSSFVEGETEQDWLVFAEDHTTDEEIKQLCACNRKGCLLEGHPSEGGIAFFELRGTEDDLQKVVKCAPRENMLDWIQPDIPVKLLENLGRESESKKQDKYDGGYNWGLDTIGVKDGNFKGTGTHIYVFDTGVRHTHEEFRPTADKYRNPLANGAWGSGGGKWSRAANVLDMTRCSEERENLDCTQIKNFECNMDINCGVDNDGHGTHCAATAAGKTVGVAPLANVHSVKMMDPSGEYDEDGRETMIGTGGFFEAAFDWLASGKGKQPAVASISMGDGVPGRHSHWRKGIDAIVDAGITVVVAAGNAGDNACNWSPGVFSKSEGSITVGATDKSQDAVAEYSNYGDCVNMWAPGSAIKSASHASNSGITTKWGTSMACPHVAGAAALAQSKLIAVGKEDKARTPNTVRGMLVRTATSGVIYGLRQEDKDRLLSVRRFLKVSL